MTKRILRGIAITAMAGFLYTVRAQDSTSQYPTILQQPEDQCLPIGGSATFSVVATNADAYQWYKNNVAMDGETNSSLTISSLSTNDVAYYGAAVINSVGSVPTRSACLNVYMTSSTTSTSTSTTRFARTLSTMSTLSAFDMGGGGSIIIYGAPVLGSGGSGNGCPGAYTGLVYFTKSITNGWGWAPSSNATVLTATDNNRADTKVQFMGKTGDNGCNSTSVNIPYPALSSKYRFTIYFTNDVPTNSYPITLTGFDQ